MNKFEFEKAMECFKCNKGVNGSYTLGKISISHDGRYFAIINGITPFPLAKLIYEKYDEKELIKLEYNLTNNTYGEHYGEKRKVTKEDKKYVVNNLDGFIKIIRKIIDRNINVTDKEQTLNKLKK